MPTSPYGSATDPNSSARVTVLGEALVDVINDPRPGRSGPQEHPGGSPLNVAVGCARLGLRTGLVTHYDDDAHGALIARHLRGNGVRVTVGGSQPTSTAVATLDAAGAADYAFTISWDLAGASIPALAAVKGSDHVHTGSLAAVLAPGNATVRSLLDQARTDATTSFDPNCRPGIGPGVEAERREVEAFVSACDIVKASDEDLRWLYPDRTVEESLAAWLELGPALVAVTRGAAGPVLLTPGGRVALPGEPVAVADTVGAGDSFMSGLISGLSQLGAVGAGGRQRLRTLGAGDLHALAGYANRAAAITCSRRGANPPTAAELGTLAGPPPHSPARRLP